MSRKRLVITGSLAGFIFLGFVATAQASFWDLINLKNTNPTNQSSEVGFVAFSPTGETGGGMIPASCESGVDVHTGLPYDSHTATYSGWSIDPTSGTPCLGGTADVGRIQGQFCVIPDGRAFSSGAVIALDGGTAPGSLQYSNPYLFNNIPSGSHAVSFIPPSGFTLTGYTLCTNSTSCHGGNITPTAPTSGAVAVNVPASGYVDLWWHCQPIPPTVDIKGNGQDGTVYLQALYPEVNVTWTAQNAVSCEILESATNIKYPQTNVFNGSWVRNTPPLTSYGIQCVNSAWTGPGDTVNIASDSVNVGIAPTADLKINGGNGPVSVTAGQALNATFVASHVGVCQLRNATTGQLLRGYRSTITNLLPWVADWYSTHLSGWLGYFTLSYAEAVELLTANANTPVNGSWNGSANQSSTYTLTCISPLWQGASDTNGVVTDSVTVNVSGSLSVSCSGSPNPALTGQSVTWTASASGGSGGYSYTWTGSDSLSGNSSSVSKVYATTGTKNASVTVTSGGQNGVANCSVAVNNNVIDQCTNIPGGQSAVPPGMTQNSYVCSCIATGATYNTSLGYCTCADGTRRDSGSCSAGVTDQCNNIAGTQSAVPTGLQRDGSGNCSCVATGATYNTSLGYCTCSDGTRRDSGSCPVVVTDQCNNIAGVQSSIPTGLRTDGAGACVCVATGAIYDSSLGFCKCSDGTRRDAGSCSASCSAPVGSSCVSASNSCGTFNTGTVRSDCSCSAPTPPEPPTGCALPDLIPTGTLNAQTYFVTGSPIYTGTYYEVGREITFSGTFRNTGAANAVIGSTYADVIQIDSDGNLNTVEATAVSQPRPVISSLARNASSGTRSDSPWTPSAPGNYNARLCVDSPGTVTESNENNNCGEWKPFVVHPGIPDLATIATRLVPPPVGGRYMVGATITIETAFWNDRASADAVPPFPVRLRVQPNQPAGAVHYEQQKNYSGPTVSYLPNAYQVPWGYNRNLPGVPGPYFSFTWQPTTAGTYTLTSCVDEPPYGGGIIPESNENNNCSILANVTVVNSTNQCGDGLDNDGDSTADCGGVSGYPADPGCYPNGQGGGGACDPNDNNETDTPLPPPPVTECNDGGDNDSDGKIDCQVGNEDPGCYPNGQGGGGACNPNDNNETNTGGSVCSDSDDNDGDGLSDSNDPGCFTNPNDPGTYNPNGGSESDSCVPGVGNFCVGPVNVCGMTLPGRQLCDGSCSAPAPSDALCSLPTISCPPGNSCTIVIPNVGGDCGVSWTATPATKCVLSGNGLNEEFTPPVGSQTISGSHTVHNVQGNKLYNITCWNGGEDTIARTFACRINPSYNPF